MHFLQPRKTLCGFPNKKQMYTSHWSEKGFQTADTDSMCGCTW